MKTNDSLYIKRDNIGLSHKEVISFTYLHTREITDQDLDQFYRQTHMRDIPQGVTTQYLRDLTGICLKMGEQVKISKKDLLRIIKRV